MPASPHQQELLKGQQGNEAQPPSRRSRKPAPVLPVSVPAAPQPRRRALAEVEAQIAQAEEVRARYARDVAAGGRAAGKDARRALVLLHPAEERLDRLRRSRDVLVAGERG